MSLYRKMDAPQAAEAGASAEGADAANKVIENLLSVGGYTETAADHQSAVKAFSEALNGPTQSVPELPPLELSSDVSAAANGFDGSKAFGSDLGGHFSSVMQSTFDIAAKMADPFGFISTIFQFLFDLFTNIASQFSQLLSQVDLYNQAAQAALDVKKLTARTN